MVLLTVFAGCSFVLMLLMVLLSLRVYLRAKETVMAFLSSPDGKAPSPFAQTVQAMSHLAAQEITASVKGALMGQMSGLARNFQGLQSDAVSDLVSQKSPLAGAALELMPNVKKRLGKMPPELIFALADIANNALTKKSGGVGAPSNGKVVEPPQMNMKL